MCYIYAHIKINVIGTAVHTVHTVHYFNIFIVRAVDLDKVDAI